MCVHACVCRLAPHVLAVLTSLSAHVHPPTDERRHEHEVGGAVHQALSQGELSSKCEAHIYCRMVSILAQFHVIQLFCRACTHPSSPLRRCPSKRMAGATT